MKLKLVTEIMQELGFDLGEKAKDEFRQLAGITALRQARDGTYYVRNWWRGPLLYALVSHYRPRSVRGVRYRTRLRSLVDGESKSGARTRV